MILFDDSAPMLKIKCENLDATSFCFTEGFLVHIKWLK